MRDDDTVPGPGAERDVHVPVLLREVLDLLAPRPGGRYLDGTLGLGGHARAVLDKAGGGAELVGLDRDERALALARERLAPFGAGAQLFLGRYSTFPEVLDELGWSGLDGALVDLGVSSLQLDSPERGFSFLADGPLDMRMGQADGTDPAASLVNRASVERLREIIGELGEEPMAGRIARAIDNARLSRPIETTRELAAIVERAYPAKWRRTARNHPATRTFQALRMAVNDELGELESFLRDVTGRLNPGGRVVVISFHSLEDRLVKYAFRREAKGCVCPPAQPVCICGGVPRLRILTKKPVTAGEDELRDNPRSRSAKLRAAERLEEGIEP
jgi:16S rRNA (cytosine1402-N4)-methyltransferase